MTKRGYAAEGGYEIKGELASPHLCMCLLLSSPSICVMCDVEFS